MRAHSILACAPGSPFANAAASTSFCAASSTRVSSCEAMLANLKHASENKIAATAVNHCTPPSNQRRGAGVHRGTLAANKAQPQIMDPGFHKVISICPPIQRVKAAAPKIAGAAQVQRVMFAHIHHAKVPAATTPIKRARSDTRSSELASKRIANEAARITASVATWRGN